jgi:hypothetical protein
VQSEARAAWWRADPRGRAQAAAARRAGRLGDGYYPIGLRTADFAARTEEMRAAARDAGRNAEDIEITYGGSMKPDSVRRFADLGVSRWVIAVWEDGLEACKRRLGELSDTLVARLS